MKLDHSIVILRGRDFATQDIDLVLNVKHPQGIDPVERIHKAIHTFLDSPEGRRYVNERADLSWAELLCWMRPEDWANHELYVESAHSWAVLEMNLSQPAEPDVTYSLAQAE